MAVKLANFLIGIINGIIKCIGIALVWVFNLLPSSPFTVIDNSSVSEYLPSINWIFPFDKVIAILELWLASILIYYAYNIVLRWFKAIA